MIVSTVLLAVGFFLSIRGRKALCACSVVSGLVLTGLIIYAGFAGNLAFSSEGVLGLSPTVTAKLAIGIAMLLFAVAWVTIFSKHRDSAAAYGLRRARRTTRPTMKVPALPPRTGRHQRPTTARP